MTVIVQILCLIAALIMLVSIQRGVARCNRQIEHWETRMEVMRQDAMRLTALLQTEIEIAKMLSEAQRDRFAN